MTQQMRFKEAGAVGEVVDGEQRKLEVLAIPYGSPTRMDRLKQWFPPRTKLMIDVGDRRPVLYMHGFSPQKRTMKDPAVIGTATVSRQDERGLWMVAELFDYQSPLATRAWDAAKRGEAGASTGSVLHLMRPEWGLSGPPPNTEVEGWPIAELSIFDVGPNRVPISDDAVVLPLRMVYDDLEIDFPEAFEAGEAKGGDGELQAKPIRAAFEQQGVATMTVEIDQAVAAALAKRDADATAQAEHDKKVAEASVEAYKKDHPERPASRALFNVPKETKAGAPGAFRITKKDEDLGITLEDKKETHEFYWNLRKGRLGNGQIPDRDAIRVATALEETEADEGLPMVPQDALTRIWEKRDLVSIARQAGITVLQTARLIFNIPREVTPMTAMAAIAENAAYVINPVAFGLLAVTVAKRGTMVSATEELLEDQNLFQGWIERAVGRAIGLGENIDLYAACDDKVGVQTTTGAPTDAELLAGYFALPQQYRNGAVVIGNDTTFAYMRALLIATPRAYGSFPDVGGEFETWMGKRIFADSNWPTLAAAGANVEYL